MQFRLSDGVEIQYEIEGEGPTLVFLPGILGNVDTYLPIVKRLRDRYRCVRLEFAGQGATMIDPRPSAEGYAIPRHTADVLELVDHLALERFGLVGLSFGSEVSVSLAGTRPEAVNKVCLLAALLRNRTEHYQNWNRVWEQSTVTPDLLTRVTAGLVYSEAMLSQYPDMIPNMREAFESVDAQHLQAFRYNLQAARTYDVESAFEQVRQPLRLIHGEADLVHPVAELRGVLERLRPDAELSELPGAGHGIHVENPAFIADAVAGFFAEP